jgi:hypothetical protein
MEEIFSRKFIRQFFHEFFDPSVFLDVAPDTPALILDSDGHWLCNAPGYSANLHQRALIFSPIAGARAYKNRFQVGGMK